MSTLRLRRIQRRIGFRAVAFLLCGVMLTITLLYPAVALTASDPWWDNTWPYRVSLTVDADGYERYDKAGEIDVNFTNLWQSIGITDSFDADSIRVVEVDGSGNVLDANVPFQFDPAASFNASTNALGTLTLILTGTTSASTTRLYYVYFGPTGGSYPAPTFTPMSTKSATVTDAGFSAFKVETTAGNWYYHKDGGGFSSLDDTNGNDWISYSTATGADGDFRGIPNMVHPTDCGFFHPGRTNVTSTVKVDGPVKVTIESKNLQPDGCTTVANAWKVVWDIYPTYARMRTVTQAPAKNFWFLYEGTPGGSVGAEDVVVWSDDATERPLTTPWCRDTSALGVLPTGCGGNDGGDWSSEWAYFVDKTVGRSLFMLHDENDTIPDAYAIQNGATSSMTVFGFGRIGNTRYFNTVPQTFYVGLVDATAKGAVQKRVDSARHDVPVTLGAAEEIVQDVTLTLSAVPTTGGSVTADPAGPTYTPGTVVSLTAIPNQGWQFDGWSGALGGSALTKDITMNVSASVNANFSPIPYTLEVNTVGNGTVQRSPDKATYTYGDSVQLTALPANNVTFGGWSGDLTGLENPQSVAVTSNKSITATFDLITYTLSIATNGNGAGTVAVEPEKPYYVSGESVQLTAQASPDSAFAGWSGSATGTDNPLTLQMNGDISVTARFDPEFHLALYVHDEAVVTVTRVPDKASYHENEVVTLTADVSPSALWLGWNGDISGLAQEQQITMDGDKQITATAKAIYYLSLYVVDGNGVVEANPPKNEGTLGPSLYADGDEVTLTAIPAVNWRFVEWGGDLSSTDNPATVRMDQDRYVTARFVHVYHLEVRQSGPGSVVIAPASTDGMYARDTEVTVEAVADPGAEFDHWQGSLPAGVSPTSPTIQFVMDADRTFDAVFKVASLPQTHVYLPLVTRQ